MKTSFFKNKLSILIAISAFVFVAGTEISYAQNTKQKAQEINTASQAAQQTQSATDARNIGNEVWDGSAKGSGTPETTNGKTVDIIGGGENIGQNNEQKSSFDPKNPEVITPWSNEIRTIVKLLAGAMAGLFVAALIIARCRTLHKSGPDTIVATIMAAAAAAACAYALALAIQVILKHGQTQLGTMWAVVCGVQMLGCIQAVYAGIDAYRNAAARTMSYLAVHAAGIGALITMATFISGAGIYVKTVHDETEAVKQYCQTTPDHPDCKNLPENR